MMDHFLSRWMLAACVVLTSCGDVSEQPLALDATAVVAGRVIVDRNGNEQVDDQADAVAPGVRVALVRNLGDTLATATTDGQGWAIFRSVPVGSYRLAIDPQVIGDSLRLVQPDSGRLVATASDTVVAFAMLGYPSATTAATLELPAGRIVTVNAVALHRTNLFGDSTLHVVDTSGTLRVTQLTPALNATPGDSVRVLGRVGTYLGRPALVAAALFPLGLGSLPAPRPLTTLGAASAGGGGFDGALVHVQGARILESATLSGGDVRLRVDDGTGVLDVVLDRSASIVIEEPPLVPGVSVDVTGILVPNATGGRWQLKPRGSSDVTADVPEATISEARGLLPGRLVSITGVAVSGAATFRDNTVHVWDPTGSIRVAVSGSPSVFPGDSLRVLGVIGIRDGQPLLLNAATSILGAATRIPPPASVNTGVAATANDGRQDAALVEVRGVTINSILSSAGGTELRVDDGTGELGVVLDPSTGIASASFQEGDRINVVGVLVPQAGGGTWVLKPRSPADVTRL